MILFNGVNIIPTDGSQAKLSNWIEMALFLLPFFLLFRFLINERMLKEMKYDKAKIKRGYTWLVIYVVLSFALLILLILYKKGKI